MFEEADQGLLILWEKPANWAQTLMVSLLATNPVWTQMSKHVFVKSK